MDSISLDRLRHVQQDAATACLEACRSAESARNLVTFATTFDFPLIAGELARAAEQIAKAQAAVEEMEKAADVAAIIHGSNLAQQRSTGLNDNNPEPAA